jgi:hypothetical protein
MTNQYDALGIKDGDTVCMYFRLTKDQFDRLVDGHKNMWSILKLGDECGPLNFLSEILHEAEKVCVKNDNN